MQAGDKFWTDWNKSPLILWQTQLCGAYRVVVGLVQSI